MLGVRDRTVMPGREGSVVKSGEAGGRQNIFDVQRVGIEK